MQGMTRRTAGRPAGWLEGFRLALNPGESVDAGIIHLLCDFTFDQRLLKIIWAAVRTGAPVSTRVNIYCMKPVCSVHLI